jgi:hypothetical protein
MRCNIKPASALIGMITGILVCLSFQNAIAQNNQAASKGYFTIENYYKVKWGYANEFVELWQKNHYPLLKKAREKGDIISIIATRPMLHSGEDTRWDFKVTITYKNAQLAFDPDLTKPYKKQLYPNQEQLDKDEQHRFEILLAHWDVMVYELALDEKK